MEASCSDRPASFPWSSPGLPRELPELVRAPESKPVVLEGSDEDYVAQMLKQKQENNMNSLLSDDEFRLRSLHKYK